MNVGPAEMLPASVNNYWTNCQEAAIRERGGVQPEYANNPGKLRSTNAWVEAAQPALLALFKLEGLVSDLDDQSCRLDLPKHIAANYGEAMGAVSNGAITLRAIIDGIRDDYISDERPGIYDDAATQEEAGDFDDWLSETTFSFDQAVQIIAARVTSA